MNKTRYLEGLVLHAGEDDIEHLCEGGLGRGLVDEVLGCGGRKVNHCCCNRMEQHPVGCSPTWLTLATDALAAAGPLSVE